MTTQQGKIGVFDSGLGGLWVLKALKEKLPAYDYAFFGDQVHVPYGNKSKEELFTYTTQALTFLYRDQNCACVLLACNTTSSAIYGELRTWAEKEFPGKLLFGIVRPTILAVPTTDPIAVFATMRTVESHAYRDGLMKEKNIPEESIHEVVMPELAGRIEAGEEVREYIMSFSDSVPNSVTTAILGCTHYGIVIDAFKNAFPHISTFLSQEEIIPEKFASYMQEKPDFEASLGHSGTVAIFVSKENHVFTTWLSKWFGNAIAAQVITLD